MLLRAALALSASSPAEWPLAPPGADAEGAVRRLAALLAQGALTPAEEADIGAVELACSNAVPNFGDAWASCTTHPHATPLEVHCLLVVAAVAAVAVAAAAGAGVSGGSYALRVCAVLLNLTAASPFLGHSVLLQVMRCARERLTEQVARSLVYGVRVGCTLPTAEGGSSMPLDGVALQRAAAHTDTRACNEGPMELYYATVFASEHIVP